MAVHVKFCSRFLNKNPYYPTGASNYLQFTQCKRKRQAQRSLQESKYHNQLSQCRTFCSFSGAGDAFSTTPVLNSVMYAKSDRQGSVKPPHFRRWFSSENFQNGQFCHTEVESQKNTSTLPTIKKCPAVVSASSSGSEKSCDANQHIQKEKRKFSQFTHGPGLSDFISSKHHSLQVNHECPASESRIPYVDELKLNVAGCDRKVFIETYGCQMNVSDTEVVWSILEKSGYRKADTVKESDVTLLMTCSIREGAEQKIWNRIQYLKSLKQRGKKGRSPMKIGVLGCMAERLKKKLIEKEKMVDLVCGPDAYRDLPRMLAFTESGQAAVNVLLSLDETYADIVPVRLNQNSPSAFVSIMRGCDNMCSYCIVPFTRGRERSRDMASILEEVRELSNQGIKEVTLLGQNVNSYRDTSETQYFCSDEATKLSEGFSTIYKPKKGGRVFSDLLDQVSLIDPEMRVRFTSPHPKDFPDEVLQLIKERPNICDQIHLPAQSGNSDILKAMRRGYTREAYLSLVDHIRSIIPDISLSSDFIAGFCGETEAAHEDTVSLMRLVKYNFAFCFPYSMRQKTHAYHRLKDDVPVEVKGRRHEELITLFREEAEKKNLAQEGQVQLVLIEGESKRSSLDVAGRNDGNTKVIIPNLEIPLDVDSSVQRKIGSGDYIAVEVTGGSSQVLKGKPLYHTTLQRFHRQLPLERAKCVNF